MTQKFLLLKTAESEDPLALDDSGSFSGIASTDDLDYSGDVVLHGAIHWDAEQLPVLLFNHDTAQVIGVIETLEWQDAGLFVSGSLALDTTKGQEVYTLLRKGALRGISVGISLEKSVKRSDGVRVVTQAYLHEVSIVALPANRNARVTSVKHQALQEDQEILAALRRLQCLIS